MVKVDSGDLVEFTYNGGSHPGSVRVIVVKNSSNTHISGLDVFAEDDRYRNFDLSKVSDFRVVRRKPVAENSVECDASVGLVLKNKKGDKLSVAYSQYGFRFNLRLSDGKDFGLVSATLPLKKQELADSVFDLLKKFVA